MEVSTTQEDILLKLSAPLCAAPDYSSQPDRQMPVLIFIRDIQSGNYLSCSPSFAVFAHRSKPEEITGLTAEELFGPDLAARFHDTDAKVLIANSTGSPFCIWRFKLAVYCSKDSLFFTPVNSSLSFNLFMILTGSEISTLMPRIQSLPESSVIFILVD